MKCVTVVSTIVLAMSFTQQIGVKCENYNDRDTYCNRVMKNC